MTLVAFDARFLFFLFDPKPAGDAKDVAKVKFLFETLSKSKSKVVVPTPALAELLVGDPQMASKVVETMDRSRSFELAPFGTREACELAAIEAKMRSEGSKRAGSLEPYQKIKVDRQIGAIAKVRGCQTLYSQDRGLRTFASSIGMDSVSIDDLPSPPEVTGDLFPA